MSANLYVIEDYENETAFRPKKTNPIQTQSPKVQNRLPENPAGLFSRAIRIIFVSNGYITA
jgi:hypothetical protein